MLNFYT